MSLVRTSAVVGLVAALSLGASLSGCSSESPGSFDVRIAPLEKILIIGGRNHFLVEAVDEAEVVVRTEVRVEKCRLTAEVRSAWGVIHGAAGGGKMEVNDSFSWNPNLDWHGVVIVHVREISEDKFVMSYVEGDAQAVAAADALDQIFASCGLSYRTELYIRVEAES